MQTIKTMIVDDEARIRRSIERFVLSCGTPFEIVASCADGLEALEYLHSTNGDVHLIITDIKMPELDGIQLVQEAKKHYRFSSLFISGYDDFEYLRSALREGAADYILKPIDKEQLGARLAEIADSIQKERRQSYKQSEMERQALQMLHAKQTQALVEVMSTSTDFARLGYWVDDFPKGIYLLMNVSLDALPVKVRAYSDRDWKAYSYALENIIKELAAGYSPAVISSSWMWRGDGEFWVLLYNHDAAAAEFLQEQAAALAEQICSSIRQYTPFTASAAIAAPFEDLYLLRNAKQAALSLANYRFILGGNRVFRFEPSETDERLGPGKLDAPFVQAVQRLKTHLQQGERDLGIRELNQCFEQLDKTDSPLRIQWLVLYLCIQIHSVWLENTEMQDSGETGNTLEQMLHKMKTAANLHQIRDEMKRWMDNVAAAIARERERHSDKPVEQARAWIMEHLQEELTVKLIADRVHMNPTYFCKYYKTKTGETIFDFITRMRMEKARALLKEGELKLQDICLQIGYQDVKYFSRLFKQLVGQTPSKYRESLLHK